METRRTLNEHERARGRLPRGRATRCAPSCCRARRPRTGSRSSRAAWRSATRCTSRRRTATSSTRDELMDQLVVLLGGRAAEQLVFGSITNGASDDLRKVADDLAPDDPRVGDGHVGQRAPARRPRAARSPTARASCATPSSSTWPTRRCGARSAAHRAPRAARRSSPPRCCARRCSSARTSSGSWRASRRSRARRPATCASPPPSDNVQQDS